MSAMSSQITGVSIVCSTVCSGIDQRRHQSSMSLTFVWIIHRWPMVPLTKGQQRGKCFHLMTSSCLNATTRLISFILDHISQAIFHRNLNSIENVFLIFSKVSIMKFHTWHVHYNDVIMGVIASQITSLTIAYSTDYSGAYKHQSSASLAFVRGIHRGPVNSPHKWSVTRKMSPFDDVIMMYKDAMRWSIINSAHFYGIWICGLNFLVKWAHSYQICELPWTNGNPIYSANDFNEYCIVDLITCMIADLLVAFTCDPAISGQRLYTHIVASQLYIIKPWEIYGPLVTHVFCFYCAGSICVLSYTYAVVSDINLTFTLYLIFHKYLPSFMCFSLQWRHNERNGVSNHWLSRLFAQPFVQAPIKENTKAPHYWPLWGESTGGFPLSALLAFVRGIYRWPVNSPHKGTQ